MARSTRTPRTLLDLLQALDHHQFLLREALHGLKVDWAHIKTLATELRTLVCLSSGTEGLLWRVADALGVSDEIELCAYESVKRDAVLNRGLAFQQLPLHRPGEGPPGRPAELLRLRDVIKKSEAIYVAQLNDRVFTHELLIGAIAGQMGGAHEAEGLDESLGKLNRFLINGVQLYVGALALDAELVLQVGERVLDHAEKQKGFQRAVRKEGLGDVTFCVRLARGQSLGARLPIVTLRSPIAEAEISFVARPKSVGFFLTKRGVPIAEFNCPDPPDWQPGADAMFSLSYSSSHRQARTILNDQAAEPLACDFGWLDARELRPELHRGYEGFILPKCLPLYGRHLSPKECGELLALPDDGGPLFETPKTDGPFPM